MNCTLGQILPANLLDEDQKHWPDYVVITEIAINSTITASISKAFFEVPYGENIPLYVDLLLFKESSINFNAHKFARKIKQLLNKVKCAIYNV